jgi:hypothetical protein
LNGVFKEQGEKAARPWCSQAPQPSGIFVDFFSDSALIGCNGRERVTSLGR